jgi:hypothetical protein
MSVLFSTLKNKYQRKPIGEQGQKGTGTKPVPNIFPERGDWI